MGTKISVNGVSIAHKGSGDRAIASAPDVCKTQVGSSVVPIPYPNVAESKDLKKGTKTVKVEGQPVAVKGCNYSKSTGDDAGRIGGVVSGTNKSKAEFTNYSFSVKMEGKNVCRHTDATTNNSGNTIGMNLGTAALASPVKKPGEKTENGSLKVTVINACANSPFNSDPIEGCSLTINGEKKTTNSEGVAVFSDLPAGNQKVIVTRAYPESDYIVFVVHYPKIAMSKKAFVEENATVVVTDGDQADLKIALNLYRPVHKIVFKRKHIDFNGEDKYGHWWVEVDGAESYGWWPKTGVGLVDTFVGVEGDLNGQARFGGTSTRDPHHGDDADESYQPILNDCRANDTVKTEVRNFVKSYVAEKRPWSWRFEAGDNCHTFQKEMIEACDFDKFKEL